MTEAELTIIIERWRSWQRDAPLVTVSTAQGLSDIEEVAKAVRAAWAETARVTQELEEAEGREALLLAGGSDTPPGRVVTTAGAEARPRPERRMPNG